MKAKPGAGARSRSAARDEVATTLSVIAEAFGHARQARLPKIAQLYNALVDVIASGRLTSGTKLPGERELSDALGISLGTTQKSLALLSRDGQIRREHGRGSFVHTDRRPMHELWHFRFRDNESGGLLPVFAKLIERIVVEDDGPWIRELGRDEAGYVKIVRRIDVDGRFACWSAMYLPFGRFGRLLDVPMAALEDVNLKQVLFAKFDAPTIAVRQTVRIGSIPDDVALAIKPVDRRNCMTFHVTALSRFADPISFQTIVVPPTEYEMEIGSDPGLQPERLRAS
jgi:DNA-binding GntR family transcriptional regulator